MLQDGRNIPLMVSKTPPVRVELGRITKSPFYREVDMNFQKAILWVALGLGIAYLIITLNG